MSDPVTQNYCVYCGLPVPPALFRWTAGGDDRQYCCSGCRFAAAVSDAPSAEGAARQQLLRIGLAIFFTMNVVVFTMELWSRDIYADASFESQFAVHLRGLFQWASLLFSLPVLLLLGGPLAASVWAALRRLAVTTDLLILMGVVASYLYSIISVLRGAGQVYFEVGCVVLVFVSLGRWLEARGKQRTGAALDSLARLLPTTVRRAARSTDAPGSETPVAETLRQDAAVGDLVRVLPGERLPLDGRIAAGRATLDEQIITGESRPIVKSVGDAVYSGALNLDGDLWIRTTATADNDMVSRMLQLVRQARRAKGRYERLADRIAFWFVPAVCALALAAAWRHGVVSGVDQGILAGLAVVLIACPCALGLATPMAVWTALGRAAGQQVMFRSGEVLERLARVRVVCFDKTGTLTSGAPELLQRLAADAAESVVVLQRAAQLAGGSSHALSQAIVAYAANDAACRSADAGAVENIRTFAGRGVAGLWRSAPDARAVDVYLGSSRWMVELGLAMPERLTDQLAAAAASDAPLVCIGWSGGVRGAFLFREQLRAGAATAIEHCRELGLELFLLTGDHRRRAAAIARELGVESLAEQLPADKAAIVRQLGPVAMVGDGLNDAPALAAAEVGVALGCGADLSRDAAGLCLLSDNLERLPWAIGLARQTLRVVRQNLFWAFVYNVGGIVLAASGRLNPVWAAAAMGLSSVMVIGNSLRLSRYALAPSADADSPSRNENAQPTSDFAALPPPPVAGQEAGASQRPWAPQGASA
ncbi:MAG: hypothetical protein DCC67_04130 [Planctomycetota bacterium]|nr:MAG: hypothetical protein DCC67_04130 [Planctomycetota bacterium]